ncbi:hypothetical protein Tco_0652254 [Tanacetum coccineum]|uniref:Retrovirus-related Pol polyprotein from transposon TNT 1-94-like beta-barrel domain-containing protein n=1 Tax=Tanacetum coccineum TaxID=301880 RepID=A0ABQ4WXF6_9ASTR
MVEDLKYFKSLEHEVASLQSQLVLQQTQFSNEIDQLSKEYFYVDHMNVVLGVYTTLDQYSDMSCDYLEALEKCECLEKELSKRTKNVKNKSFNELSKKFAELEQHCISLELSLQHKNKIFQNERPCKNQDASEFPEFFEINKLKAQLQDKNVAIRELKKLIAKMKGESVDTNFVKPSLLEIILFIVDSGCSKHMTGNLKLLVNFVEKFLGTVRFRNDQFALILTYGDLVQGNITIKRVYYVEGLNHNLFSVGQFCDADLEVAFRKSTCYVYDLKGNDLLTGSRGADLCSITL